MPKYRVKPYENYIELYPESYEVRQVFPAGSIVTVEDPKNDLQMCKLELVKGGDVKAKDADAPLNVTTADTTQSTTDNDSRKKAQQALNGF
jgi:hypothetical protein